MCARADAEIMLVFPISAVVPRFKSRLCEVGHFVLLVARCCEKVDETFHLCGGCLFVRFCQCTPGGQMTKVRTRFNGERIGGNVIRSECDGRCDGFLP